MKFFKPLPPLKNIPTEYVGCWHLISGIAALPYIQISAGGVYSVASGVSSYSVSVDGLTLTLDSINWLRHLGSGQTIFGVWRNNNEELYIRDNFGTMYFDQVSEIPGALAGVNDLNQGNFIYWEKRAIISSSFDNSDGTHTITAFSAFGGTYNFIFKKQGNNLILGSEIGNEFEYEPVACQTLSP
jgi:hypothetical protein